MSDDKKCLPCLFSFGARGSLKAVAKALTRERAEPGAKPAQARIV